jgi:predicted Zn finger-like uncharacterized protein
MILTCPACGTQYVVKDGAIPPQGRQVRCAACRHSWHQDAAEDPETSDAPVITSEEAPPALEDSSVGHSGAVAGASEALAAPVEAVETPETVVEPEPVAQPWPAADDAGEPVSEPAVGQPPLAEERIAEVQVEPAEDADFSPFARSEFIEEPRRRSPILIVLLLIVLIAAGAAAFWFLAPPEWKQRLGIAGIDETPLQLLVEHHERQQLASGNELLALSGRVINPTDRPQSVPPIHAELKSSAGKVVYRWTIDPPARTLAPRESASFNSAQVNIPPGGEDLTISLDDPNA